MPTGEAVASGVVEGDGVASGQASGDGLLLAGGEASVEGCAEVGEAGAGEDVGETVAIGAGVSLVGRGCQLGLHSKSGVCVRRRSSVPSARTTKMSENPGSSWAKPTKVTMVSSGDQAGCSSPRQTAGDVGSAHRCDGMRGRWSLPSEFITYMAE